MARPRGNRKEARTSVSFDADEYAQLCKLAQQRDVSVAWMIRQAVHELIRHEKDISENPEIPLPSRQTPHRGMTP